MTHQEATAPGAVSLSGGLKALRVKPGDLFGTFGNEELCTWRVGPRVCRFQTRRPDFARKLSQRSSASLVAWSVSGGYLRVYQETIDAWRARNLVKRYVKAANGAFSPRMTPASASEVRESLRIAANCQ